MIDVSLLNKTFNVNGPISIDDGEYNPYNPLTEEGRRVANLLAVKKYRETNREEVLRKDREYKKEHREQGLAQKARYREKNRELLAMKERERYWNKKQTQKKAI